MSDLVGNPEDRFSRVAAYFTRRLPQSSETTRNRKGSQNLNIAINDVTTARIKQGDVLEH